MNHFLCSATLSCVFVHLVSQVVIVKSRPRHFRDRRKPPFNAAFFASTRRLSEVSFVQRSSYEQLGLQSLLPVVVKFVNPFLLSAEARHQPCTSIRHLRKICCISVPFVALTCSSREFGQNYDSRHFARVIYHPAPVVQEFTPLSLNVASESIKEIRRRLM